MKFNVTDKNGELCGIVEAESAEAAVIRVQEMEKKQNLPARAVAAEERPERTAGRGAT